MYSQYIIHIQIPKLHGIQQPKLHSHPPPKLWFEALSYLRSCPKTLDACNFLLDGFSREDLGDSAGAICLFQEVRINGQKMGHKLP